MLYDDFVAETHERWSRWPRSPSNVPGPPPTASRHVARTTQGRVQADECKREPETNAAARTARRHVSGTCLTRSTNMASATA